ncbi:MAG: radical SAM protein [Nitrososphaerota archaeon]|jgi:radical SAM protein with 4Fe4S-binding SPASM domain|nr:radical SAM protein [Nitrososphaerota archaeon]
MCGRGEIMHIVSNYIFDSGRLIIYKSNVDKEPIDAINSAFEIDVDYKTILSDLTRLNSDEMHMDKIAINEIGICLTYNCNLRCNYCGYSSSDRDKYKLQLSDVKIFIKDSIKKRAIKKLLTKKNEPFTISFTGGGEPTYDWDLLKNTVIFIKQQCAENNIPVYLKMTTNGVLLSEQIAFIAENFNELMISYDGLPETQNLNRISPNLKDTNSAVEHSIREFTKRGVPLNIRTTIWQNDYPKIKEMYYHIFSLVPEDSKVTWSIYPTLFEGRAAKRIKQQEDRTYKAFLFYYIDLVEHIISEKGEEKIKTVDVPLLNNDVCGLFCGAYRLNHPWLLPDKSIITCIEYKDAKVVIGKINNGKLEYFEKYCDEFLKISQEKYVACRSCIAYRFCRGGCPVWHLRRNTEINEPLECHLQKAYWKYILEAVLLGKYSFGWHLEKIDLPNIKEQEIFKLVKTTKVS